MQKYNFFGKKISGKFTIPSGIVTTNVSVIEKIASEVPQIGILTTKSIGLEQRDGNREPIIAGHSPFSFVNAVGLTNPGAKNFANNLSKIKIPNDKFLLISIFGKDEKDFLETAKILYNFADGFEVNLSCPHASRYGQAIGKDLNLVKKIIKNVSSLGKPVFAKISPNLDIKESVLAMVNGGASGIVAINTKGPEEVLFDNFFVLSNKKGGVSGRAILETGIECVKKIRKITDIPIIACGGISRAKDIEKYKKAGANFFGVGSALAGMSTKEIKEYFLLLEKDIKEDSENAENMLKKDLNINYKKYKIRENKKLEENLFILEMEDEIKADPGQFVFTWLPEKGEKPFSIFDDNPLKFLIQKRGCFTEKLSKLRKGDDIYLRGPYGNSPKICGKTLLVGGGTGIAALYLFAKRNKESVALLGGKDKKCLLAAKGFSSFCKDVFFVTENGEIGKKGLVTDLLEKVIKETKPKYCINCGPKAMVDAVCAEEQKYILPKNIYSSVEFLTKCGIGLCGSCATSDGKRSCVDGTFF